MAGTGQAKITQITRYDTIALALLQSAGTLVLIETGQLFGTGMDTSALLPDKSLPMRLLMMLTLTAGTAIIKWLGEFITDHGIGNLRDYVGHGVGRALHEDPRVPHYGRSGRGIKLMSGLVIAIESMFNLGTYDTKTLEDDWTVVTADGKWSAHWEHTVAITPDGPWVLTARSDEPEHPDPDFVWG